MEISGNKYLHKKFKKQTNFPVNNVIIVNAAKVHFENVVINKDKDSDNNKDKDKEHDQHNNKDKDSDQQKNKVFNINVDQFGSTDTEKYKTFQKESETQSENEKEKNLVNIMIKNDNDNVPNLKSTNYEYLENEKNNYNLILNNQQSSISENKIILLETSDVISKNQQIEPNLYINNELKENHFNFDITKINNHNQIYEKEKSSEIYSSKYNLLSERQPNNQVQNQNQNVDEPQSETSETSTKKIDNGNIGKYVCTYCNLACSKPSVLQKHIRAHTNERPYPCVSCGFSFKTRSNLYKHCRSRTHANRVMGNKHQEINSIGNNNSNENETESLQEKPESYFSETSQPPINHSVDQNEHVSWETKSKPYKPKFHTAKLFFDEENSRNTSDSVERIDMISETPKSCTNDLLKLRINELIHKNNSIVNCDEPILLRRRNCGVENGEDSPSESISSPNFDEPLNLSAKNRKRCISESTTENTTTDRSLIKQLLLKNLNPDPDLQCGYCKMIFASVPELEMHKIKYCTNIIHNNKRYVRSSSVNVASILTQNRMYGNEAAPLALPLKSPGPFLGKTRLIETDKNDERFRTFSFDDNAISLRTNNITPEVESPISKYMLSPSFSPISPLKKNSVKLFGGEVKITQTSGETRSFKIESESNNKIGGDGYEDFSSGSVSKLSENLVIKSSLGSGGTVLQSKPTYQNQKNINLPSPSLIRYDNSNTMTVASPKLNIPAIKNDNHYFDKGQEKIILGPVPVPPRKSPNVHVRESSPIIKNYEEKDFKSNLIDFSQKAIKLITPNLKAPNLAIPGLPVPMMTISPEKYSPNPITIDFENQKDKNHVDNINFAKKQISLQQKMNNFIQNVDPPGLYNPVNLLVEGKVVRYVPGMPGPVETSLELAPKLRIQGESPRSSREPLRMTGEPSRMFESPRTLEESPKMLEESFKMTGEPPRMFESSKVLGDSPRTLRESPRMLGESPKMTGEPSRMFESPKMLGETPRMPTEPPRTFDSSKTTFDSPKTSLDSPKMTFDSTKPLNGITKVELRPPTIIIDRPNDNIRPSEMNHRTEDLKMQLVSKIKMDFERRRCVDEPKDKTEVKKFVRPNSLALKPSSVAFKQHHGLTPTMFNQALISPDTPRVAKKFVQQYLNGNYFSYLGLKSSTKSVYCTLNKTQPFYVKHFKKLSMYSEWRQQESKIDSLAVAAYDSRQGQTKYTTAGAPKADLMVHSSYKFVISESTPMKNDNENVKSSVPGGYESNENYTYIRGRGRGRYVCDQCGIRCKKPSMLKKHLRTHSDDRPYTCEHCNFSFKTKGNLTKHMKSKSHTKKFSETSTPTTNSGTSGSESEDSDAESSDESTRLQEQEHEAAHCLLSLAQKGTPPPNINTDNSFNLNEYPIIKDDSFLKNSEQITQVNTTNFVKNKILDEPNLTFNCTSKPITDNNVLDKEESESEKSDNFSQYFGKTSLIRPLTYPYQKNIEMETNTNSSSTIPISNSNPNSIQNEKFDSQNENFDLRNDRKENQSSRSPGVIKIIEKTQTKFDENPNSEAILARNTPSEVISGRNGSSEGISARNVPSEAMLCRNVVSETISARNAPSEGILVRNAPSETILSRNASSELSLLQNFEGNLPANVLMRKRKLSGGVTVTIQNKVLRPDESLQEGGPMNLSNNNSPALDLSSSFPSSSSETIKNDSRFVRFDNHDFKNQFLTVTIPTNIKKGSDDFQNEQQFYSNPKQRTNSFSSTKSEQDFYGNYDRGSSNSPLHKQRTSSYPGIRSHDENVNNQPLDLPLSYQLSSSKSRHSSFSESNSSETFSNSENDLLRNNKSEDSQSIENPSVIYKSVNYCSDSTNSNVLLNDNNDQSAMQTLADIAIKQMKNEKNILAKNVASVYLKLATKNESCVSEGSDVGGGAQKYNKESEMIVKSEENKSCTICFKNFSKPSQLRLHMNIHYLERPYRCEPCSVSFRTKGHLQKHERSASHHNKLSSSPALSSSEPRPFKCSDCNIAFRIHGHLAKHLRSKMHIMKLECLAKIPFGLYAELERANSLLTEINTTDGELCLESLKILARKLFSNDPNKMDQISVQENRDR